LAVGLGGNDPLALPLHVGAHDVAQHLGCGLVLRLRGSPELGLQLRIDAKVEGIFLRVAAEPGHAGPQLICLQK
jgi:hypothetical protein